MFLPKNIKKTVFGQCLARQRKKSSSFGHSISGISQAAASIFTKETSSRSGKADSNSRMSHMLVRLPPAMATWSLSSRWVLHGMKILHQWMGCWMRKLHQSKCFFFKWIFQRAMFDYQKVDWYGYRLEEYRCRCRHGYTCSADKDVDSDIGINRQ